MPAEAKGKTVEMGFIEGLSETEEKTALLSESERESVVQSLANQPEVQVRILVQGTMQLCQ